MHSYYPHLYYVKYTFLKIQTSLSNAVSTLCDFRCSEGQREQKITSKLWQICPYGKTDEHRPKAPVTVTLHSTFESSGHDAWYHISHQLDCVKITFVPVYLCETAGNLKNVWTKRKLKLKTLWALKLIITLEVNVSF